MWAFLGCTGPLALVGFVLGYVGTFLAPAMPIGQRFATAGAMGALVFVAAALLCISDMRKQRAALDRVRRRLEGRRPMSDDRFAAALDNVDRDLAIDVRHALAKFLDVPAESIYPSDSPAEDLGGKDLEPQIHFSVVGQIIQDRAIAAGGFHSNSAYYDTMPRFISEIDRAISEAMQDAS